MRERETGGGSSGKERGKKKEKEKEKERKKKEGKREKGKRKGKKERDVGKRRGLSLSPGKTTLNRREDIKNHKTTKRNKTQHQLNKK